MLINYKGSELYITEINDYDEVEFEIEGFDSTINQARLGIFEIRELIDFLQKQVETFERNF